MTRNRSSCAVALPNSVCSWQRSYGTRRGTASLVSTARSCWFRCSCNVYVRRHPKVMRETTLTFLVALSLLAGCAHHQRTSPPATLSEMVHDVRYDWRATAFAIDGRVVCPRRTESDTTLMANIEAARTVVDLVKAIDVTRAVPESIQRSCPERLRRVIFLHTR